LGIKAKGTIWRLAVASVAILLMPSTATAQEVIGWYKAGSAPADYETGVDPKESASGAPSGYIRSLTSRSDTFGTLMQEVDATAYRGRRLRFSAAVKSRDVIGVAALWMRVDRVDRGRTTLAFDNMRDRPITGTSDWTVHEIVLDVDPSATGVFFGVLLNGLGQAWVSDVRLDIVTEDVPVTDLLRRVPRNLDFEDVPR
jgi:hypothetical protein